MPGSCLHSRTAYYWPQKPATKGAISTRFWQWLHSQTLSVNIWMANAGGAVNFWRWQRGERGKRPAAGQQGDKTGIGFPQKASPFYQQTQLTASRHYEQGDLARLFWFTASSQRSIPKMVVCEMKTSFSTFNWLSEVSLGIATALIFVSSTLHITAGKNSITFTDVSHRLSQEKHFFTKSIRNMCEYKWNCMQQCSLFYQSQTPIKTYNRPL